MDKRGKKGKVIIKTGYEVVKVSSKKKEEEK